MRLEELCYSLAEAKDIEDSAKKQRIELEGEIAKIVATKEEGVEKMKAGQFMVSVTSKLTRSLDYEAYRAVEEGIPEGVRCVDMKPALNLKKLRALEMIDPALPAQFITVKPAKPSVKLEVAE